MKLKPAILLLVGFFVCGWIAWLCYAPSPTTRFIEFRDGEYYPDVHCEPGQRVTPEACRMAVFRITNNSHAPYSYFGNGPSLPFYIYRYPDPSHDSGWLTISPRKYGGVADTIAPRSFLEIVVPEANTPFAIGINFERGTAEQLQQNRDSRSGISKFIRWLRCLNVPNYYGGPEPTWSTVAHDH